MITIKDGVNEEMLEILNSDGKQVFYGSYWDFHRDGLSLESFLTNLGLEVEVQILDTIS